MYWPVPLIVGEQVEHEEFRLGDIGLLGRNLDNDLVLDEVGELRRHNAGLQCVLLVDRDADLAGDYVVHGLSALEHELGVRVLEHIHHGLDRDDLIPCVIDIYGIIGTVEILLLAHTEIQRPGLVAGPFHLADVPVGSEKGSVADSHVGADVLHLLGIPEREGVIVAVGHEDALLAYGIEIVPGHLHGCAAVAPVVVVPVLLCHESRHEEAGGGEYAGCRSRIFILELPANPFIQSHHGQADPDAECVERAGVGVIPFPDLVRRLVEVEHNGDSRHEEQQEGQPAAPLVPLELEEDAHNSEKERKEVIMVLSLVFGKDSRSVALVSETDAVDELDAAFPVAVEYFSRARAVNVILPSGEVPHEISPVHPVHLEVEEEFHVGPE